MLLTSFEFGKLSLCRQVFCQCTASLSQCTGSQGGGEQEERSSAADCRGGIEQLIFYTILPVLSYYFSAGNLSLSISLKSEVVLSL